MDRDEELYFEVDMELINELVEQLVRDGALEENPSDSTMIRITPKGAEFLDNTLKEAAETVFGSSEDTNVSQLLAHFNEFELLGKEDLLIGLMFEKQDDYESLKEYLKDKGPAYRFH